MVFKVDMNKAKKRGELLREESAFLSFIGRPTVRFKCHQGTNRLRFLPPWTEKGPNSYQFWREVHQHFGVMSLEDPDENNKFVVLCPKKTPDAWHFFGTDPKEKLECRVCNARNALAASPDPMDNERAKNMKTTLAAISNVYDYDDPVFTRKDIEELKSQGVREDSLPTVGSVKIQVYSYGTTIFKEILDYYQDNLDITDLENGRDITIEREGTGLKTKYRVRYAAHPSAVPLKEKEVDNNLYDLDKVVRFLTDEQVEMALSGGTKEEVYKLSSGASSKKQLPAPEVKDEPEAEPEEEEYAADADTEDAPPPTVEEEIEVLEVHTDANGDINFDKYTDEDLENKDNAHLVAKEGTDAEHSVYIECFGTSREREPDCEEICSLYERCGRRIIFLDEQEALRKKEEEAKKAAKKPGKRKAAGKKAAQPAKKKTAGKKKATTRKASKNGNGTSSIAAGSLEELAAEMKTEISRKQSSV